MRALLVALCLAAFAPARARADMPPYWDAGEKPARVDAGAVPADAGAAVESDKTGCSLAPGSPLRDVGALLFAGAFSTLVFVNRRKHRRSTNR